MLFSSKLQRFVEQLAMKHEVDLTQIGASLCLALPPSSDYLVLQRLDAWHLYIARVVEEGNTYFIPDPSVLVFTCLRWWLPLEVLYSEAEWQKFVSSRLLGTTAQGQDHQGMDLVDFIEAWAQRLLDEGWLAHGEKVDKPTGRMAGCQSTNHTECYGELWQCAACNKVVCYAEGTDNHPELCDDCWAKRYASPQSSETEDRTDMDDQSIVVACDCIEYGDECGTWLELTPDGFLALEDKDGLRVSIMLPQWLDDAVRNAVQRKKSGVD